MPPAEIDSAQLIKLVGHVAAAALLIRYWPPKGNRHDLSLALGGCLARAGWEPQAIEAFVGIVVQAPVIRVRPIGCAVPGMLPRRSATASRPMASRS